MNKIDFSSRPLNQVTRENRAVYDETWIKAMLRRAALRYAGNQPGRTTLYPHQYVRLR